MPGTLDLDTVGAGLAAPALPVAVYAYDPAGGYSLLPNVIPLRIDRREGCAPSSARFGYLLDDAMAATFGWPSRFEEVFGLYSAAGSNAYVVAPDQRIVILSQYPDGSPWVLWDGFAQVQQMDVSRRAEGATFVGVGVEVRCWDQPITGRVQRDSDPTGIDDTSGGSDVSTDLRPRFNPANNAVGGRAGSLPNASPDNQDTTLSGSSVGYPVFIDPGLERTPDPRRYWSVGMAVRYVLGTENSSQTYVSNPDFGAIDDQLQTYQTAPGSDVLDPNDPSTYTVAPAQVPDLDVAGMPWPDAVATLIAYCGFLARFDTYTAGDGSPQTVLAFYRRDEFAAVSPKSVYLAEPGTALDLTTTNAQDIHLALDGAGIVNAYEVETAQRRVEVSWILAPLYQPAAADAQAANRVKYRSGNLAMADAATRRKYRWYGADECGDGHWDGAAWSTTPCDFAAIFPPDNDYETYCYRYRPGSKTLIATDGDGRPLKADLSISFDYAGDAAAPWDGTGTWQSLSGGWRLLPDRLGIEVTVEDPETWGAGQGGGLPALVGGALLSELVPGGGVRGITWWAAPPSGAPCNGKAPVFRLTTVIEDDLRMPITAPKRVASPTAYARWRVADRRDQFEYAAVDVSSLNYEAMINLPDTKTNDQQQVVVRDDTQQAQALAEQLRGAHEMPTIAGTITLPFISDYYQIGDRIEGVSGRDCLLQTNIGADQGEAPTYPWVVGVSWNFDGGQSTTITLSDRRALPSLPLVSYRRSRR